MGKEVDETLKMNQGTTRERSEENSEEAILSSGRRIAKVCTSDKERILFHVGENKVEKTGSCGSTQTRPWK